MMEIRSGKSEFKVLCLPKEDYPMVPEAGFEKRMVLPLDRFQEMIDRVYFPIAQEQRYYLNGALLILKKDSMELVSTDGHRLSYTSMFVEGLDPGEEVRGVVAKKSLGELRKMTKDAAEFDNDENTRF